MGLKLIERLVRFSCECVYVTYTMDVCAASKMNEPCCFYMHIRVSHTCT